MFLPITGYIASGPGPAGYGAFDPKSVGRVAGRVGGAATLQRYRSLLDAIADGGVLRRLDQPSMVRYRISSPDGLVLEGLVCAVALGDETAPVLPHEQTLAIEARGRRGRRARPSIETTPIVVFDERGFEFGPFPPANSFFDTPTGHRHEVAVVPPMSLAPRPLVIADGHHRHAIAVDHARSRRAEVGPGPSDAILAFVVASGTGLRSAAVHRRFDRVDPLDHLRLAEFSTTPVDVPAVPAAGTIVLWPGAGRGSPVALRLREGLGATMPAGHEASSAAIAQQFLYRHLGVDEAQASYETRVDDAIVGLPSEGAAVLTGPTPTRAVALAALGGSPLPPKTTRFMPKPYRGVVIRPVA